MTDAALAQSAVADVEMARAKSYARGFQDGLKAQAALAQSDAKPVAANLDRIAMALHDEWNGVGRWASLTDSERKRWLYMAKAALSALAQSDAEPVGWDKERAIGMREAVNIMHAAGLSSKELKLVDKNCDWQAFKHAFNAVMKDRAARVLASVDAIETERAYTAPHRPDVSAGLIEAAEIVKDWARACFDSEADLLNSLEKILLSRASDRSGT